MASLLMVAGADESLARIVPQASCDPDVMDRSDAIARLHAASDRLREVGVLAMYLFGSVARDEAEQDSDVDLFVDPDYERFGFVELLHTEAMLSTALGRKVDLTTREGLHPFLRAEIEREAVRVL